ncbi:hypothetical protein BJX61DRAFT_539925 [Aspergillus egyptiacus]|nr:hypothetical protein BJX61DRAFT_539925 [Aspergillus egyptiacus]
MKNLSFLFGLLLLTLTHQSSAFLLNQRWKYDPVRNVCWTVPLLMWGRSDPNCPRPPPNPQAVAQQVCDGKTPGSIALFTASGAHYACAMPQCNQHPTLPAILGECP